MKRFVLDPDNLPTMTEEELARLDAIDAESTDDEDNPEITEEFLHTAQRVYLSPNMPKQKVTIRLDEDVLAWLKSSGSGYQTRANRILRAAMEHSQLPTAN